MARGFLNGQTDESIKACGTKASLMEKAHLVGLTVESTEDSIKMTKRTGSVCLSKQTGKNILVIGQMAYNMVSAYL